MTLKIGDTEYRYDPAVGLVPVHDARKHKAPPNPISAPPIDPRWQEELASIGRRIGRTLRFYWMRESRIWSIQQLEPNGRGWETTCCNYDEHGSWSGNPYPYRPVDRRFLDEFCESDLKQTVGTGDIAKDGEIYTGLVSERGERLAMKKAKDMEETIEAVVTGGDDRRFARLLQHEDMHAGPGVRYTEFFPGADLTKE